MKINIWSDVRCPFCFVGKKKFEKALEKFPHAEKLEITWHISIRPTIDNTARSESL